MTHTLEQLQDAKEWVDKTYPEFHKIIVIETIRSVLQSAIDESKWQEQLDQDEKTLVSISMVNGVTTEVRKVGDDFITTTNGVDTVTKIANIELPMKQPSVPQGWKLVPIEPTTAMQNAAVDETGLGFGFSWKNKSPQGVFRSAYRAMLAAAPKHGGE